MEVEEDGAGMDSASDEDDKSAARSGQHSPVKENGLINYTIMARSSDTFSTLTHFFGVKEFFFRCFKVANLCLTLSTSGTNHEKC